MMVKPRTKKQPNPLSNISYVDFLALAGVLFVGASIVTYITNYWDVLPRGAYLFLFLVLTALPYAASAWAVLAQKEGLSDILLFVGGVVVAGALVFIMFAYNFNSQITYYIIPLLYLAMLLPALITGQRTFLFWAALVIPLWTLGPSAQLTGSELLVHLLILASMAFPVFLTALWKNWSFGLHMGLIFTLLCLSSLLRSQAYISGEEITLLVTLLYFYGVLKGLIFEKGKAAFLPSWLSPLLRFFQPMGGLLARYCAIGLTFLFLINPPFDLSPFPYDVPLNPWLLLLFIPLSAALALSALFLHRKKFLRQADVVVAFAGIPVVLLLAVYGKLLPLSNEIFLWLHSACALGLVLWLINWSTVRRDRFTSIIGYIFLPGTLCYSLILLHDFDAWKQSLTLLLSGLAIVIYGVFHSKRMTAQK